MIVYISIGNSDDKLTQRQWSEYIIEVKEYLKNCKVKYHGDWYSLPSSPYQNACFCVEFNLGYIIIYKVKEALGDIAHEFRQDSVAWVEATATEFIKGDKCE
jgi:hypothetical protein